MVNAPSATAKPVIVPGHAMEKMFFKVNSQFCNGTT